MARIPWGHNILIFTKCQSLVEAGFYLSQTLVYGWGRDVLALQLKSNLYARAGKAASARLRSSRNFSAGQIRIGNAADRRFQGKLACTSAVKQRA